MLCDAIVGVIRMIRTYSELSKFQTFEERYRYLKLDGVIGQETFGFDRYLNQLFYTSKEWRFVRDKVIIRDNGCDLGIEEYEINGHMILIHHMNPITVDDILARKDYIFDPEFLICTTKRTHNAIHYGDESLLPQKPVIRRKNDTCPWRD